jgi:ankyrin repeat protein
MSSDESASRKRERDEEEEEERKQKELDDALLAASVKGSLNDVKKALANGGFVNAVDEEGSNGLSLACRRDDWNVAAQIVKLLLNKRFLPSVCDTNGWNAVHYAARYSSAEVMKLLLEKHASLVHTKSNKQNWTPLCLLCNNRFDDEAVRVASLLLDHGAKINQVCGEFDDTPLLLACWKGRADLVSLLLERGANVKAVRSDGLNVLHCACMNGAFGKEIIPLLVKAGADVNAVDKFGKTALTYAITRSYDFGKEMLKYLPSNSTPSRVFVSKADPIGALTLNRELGKEIHSSWFADNVNNTPEWDWARLRIGPLLFDESRRDVFNALARCKQVKLWILASREPDMQRHPKTGETVLHLLARSDALTTEQKLECLQS